MADAPKAFAHSISATRASVEASSFNLDLGHLRVLVAAADRLGMTDDADVTFGGIGKSYSYVDEFTAKKAVIRAEDWTRVEAPRGK